MKKILITGADSYIGESFKHFLKRFSDYSIDTVDMLDGGWKEKGFNGYDVIYHVAGIAHIKEKPHNAHLYYEINRDLAIEVGKRAKEDGVKQFIFLSTISIYGKNTGRINKATEPKPKSNYGKSKLQAEEELLKLQSNEFKVTVLRPPMVYGLGCKGNFQSVIKIVKKSPVFPLVNNKRSMIYVDNLSSFVKLCIDKETSGIYRPQDLEYVNTTEMARLIANKLGKKLYCSYFLGGVVCVAGVFLPLCKKAFGNLIYEDADIMEEVDYIRFNESIRDSVE